MDSLQLLPGFAAAAFAAILIPGSTVLLGYAMTAARFRSRLTRADVRQLCNRSGAGCLVGAGIYTLSMPRSG